MYLLAENSGFIATYGALILAVFAIVQVWIIALWKKFIWTGKIDILNSGWIEIGFSGWGPTISLNGSLRARRKEVFVKDISLSVTRESDGANLDLQWAAFKSPQIKLGDPTSTTVELPSGVNVRTDQPLRYSYVFCNKTILSQIQRRLAPIQAECKEYGQSKQDKILRALSKSNAVQAIVLEQIFEEYIDTSEIFEPVLRFHESTNWWEVGKYRLRINVNASIPDKIFSKEWSFVLDEDACSSLKENSMATMREICTGRVDHFIFSAEYIETK